MALRQQEIPGIPSARDEQIANWVMDTEESHAYFHIFPVVEGEDRFFTISTAIAICPYPNPFGYGGTWEGGGRYDLAGLRAKVKSFRKELQTWRDKGMYKVEFKRLPAEVRHPMTEEEEREEAINRAMRGSQGPKVSHDQPALF